MVLFEFPENWEQVLGKATIQALATDDVIPTTQKFKDQQNHDYYLSA